MTLSCSAASEKYKGTLYSLLKVWKDFLATLVQGLVNDNPVHRKSAMDVSLASKSIPIDPLEAILGLPRKKTSFLKGFFHFHMFY